VIAIDSRLRRAAVRARIVVVLILLVLIAAAYGWWRYYLRGVMTPGKAVATVDVWEKDAGCTASRVGRPSGRRMPCAEIGRYLNGSLSLVPGDGVLIVAMGDVKPSAIDAVAAEVVRSGYRAAGVYRLERADESH
jgi:hypothetical protein